MEGPGSVGGCLRGVLPLMCLRGPLPPTNLRATCLVLAIVMVVCVGLDAEVESNLNGLLEAWTWRLDWEI